MHFKSRQFDELKAEIRALPPLEGALKYFEAKLPDLIKDQPIGDCWSYHRKDPDGYGLLSVFGKSYRLHRLSYQFFNGPLQEDEWALHKCNHPNCWNPSHLYAGSGADNAADRIAAGAVRGKLPDEVVFEIKRLIKQGLSNGAIAKEIGVTPGCISHIRLGKRRKDIAA